jgi:hypothetical protein
LHLVPLLFSPLPFNPDGFALANVAGQISSTGMWRINGTGVIENNQQMPIYPLLWSILAQLGGLDVLANLQGIMPLVTATIVLPAYLLAVKATRSRVAGFAAGLFVAVFGSFLFLTSAAMRESIGLVLFPVIVLLYAERSDPRKRALAALLLLLLPFLHHLTTLLTLGMVSALLVLGQSRSIARGTFSLRRLALDILTGPFLAVVAWAWYSAVREVDVDEITAADAIVLLLGIVVLLTALLAPRVRPARVRPGRRLVSPAGRVLLVPALAFAALWVNGRTSVFVGVVGTQGDLVAMFPAIAILVGFAIMGYQLLRRTTNRGNDLVLAMFVAPIALILLAFLRGLDPFSQMVVYRSFDFVDYGLGVLAGIGLAAVWSRVRPSKAARLALGATFVVALLATTPMAWNSQAVFGVNEVTTPAEFHALSVLASLHPKHVTTDQRLALVLGNWFGYNASSTLPFRLQNDERVTGYDYAIVADSWTTVGAQVFPAPNVVLSRDVLASFLQQNRVVYAGGSGDNRVYVVQLTGS